MRMFFVRSFLVASTVPLVGCSDVPSFSEPGIPSRSSGAAETPAVWSLDDTFERIARHEIPGFAGNFLDGEGNQVVLLKDMNQRSAAESFFMRQPARQQAQRVLFRQARYDFPSLRSWSLELTNAIASERTFAVDVDEVENRVWVGVTTEAGIGMVRREAARLGIPNDAVTVSLFQVPVTRATLLDTSPSKEGGYQIQTHGWSCTLGFNALLRSQRVFVTASHCSGAMNQVDNVLQYQAVYGLGNEIGYEVADPNLRTCRPLWYSQFTVSNCRTADASAYAYYSHVSASLGRIARTTWYGANQRGSLTIEPATPFFQITAKNTGGGAVGTWVDKVGRTSGWTRGQVTHSCVLLSNAGVYYKCQTKTSTWSEPGDSGSPMFIVSSGVTLTGLLWGGPPGNWGETWYSPIGGVEEDFGAPLTVF